jgi:hypothetical protein
MPLGALLPNVGCSALTPYRTRRNLIFPIAWPDILAHPYAR